MAFARASDPPSEHQAAPGGDDSRPAGSTPGPRRRTRCIITWAVLMAVLVFFLWTDIALMRWRFATFPNGFSGGAQQIIFGFRDFAQIVPIVVAGIIVLCTDRRRRWPFLLALVLGQLLGLAAGHSTKWLVQRYRPFPVLDRAAAAAGIRPDQERDNAALLAHVKPGDTWVRRADYAWPPSGGRDSFPSGHALGAFAFAVVLVCFYPRLSVLFWILAVGCSASRFLDAMHWPSDCLVGCVVGYVGGRLALRIQQRVLPASISSSDGLPSSDPSGIQCSDDRAGSF